MSWIRGTGPTCLRAAHAWRTVSSTRMACVVPLATCRSACRPRGNRLTSPEPLLASYSPTVNYTRTRYVLLHRVFRRIRDHRDHRHHVGESYVPSATQNTLAIAIPSRSCLCAPRRSPVTRKEACESVGFSEFNLIDSSCRLLFYLANSNATFATAPVGHAWYQRGGAGIYAGRSLSWTV